MSITFHSVSSAEIGSGSPVSMGVTVPSGLSDVLLVALVGLNPENGEAVDDVTFGGTGLTRLGTRTVGNDATVELWYLKNPSSGTATLRADFDENLENGAVLGAYVLSGVDLVDTFSTLQTDADTSGSASLSVSVASEADDLVIGFAMVDSSSLSNGSGQTLDFYESSNSDSRGMAARKTASGSSTTMAFSVSSGSQGSAMLAVAISPTAAAPEIDVSPTSHNFGNVNVGDSGSHTITVENTGAADLTVSAITLNNNAESEFGLSGLPSLPAVIAGGGNITFDVTFTPGDTGAESASVDIESDDSDESTVTVNLSGTGTAPEIGVSPVTVNHGSVVVGQTDSRTVTVENTGSGDLTVSAISLNNNPDGEFALSGLPSLPATVAPSGSFSFDIVFSPLNDGAAAASVDIASDDSDEATVTVNASGTGVSPEIGVSPGSVDFGDVVLGESDGQTITISNSGTADLTVTGISLNNPSAGSGTGDGEFALSGLPSLPVVIAPAGSVDFTVTFSPTSRGSETASIGIESDDADEATVTVNLAGNGISQEIGVSPAAASFGDVGIRSSGSRLITVANVGDNDLTISGITLSNNEFVEFSLSGLPAFPVTLGAGEDTTFSVVFAPVTTGFKTASVAIASDDENTPEYTLSLTGNGLTVSSYTNNAHDICATVVAELRAGISDATFDCVMYFPDEKYQISRARRWRAGLLKLTGSRSYFVQDRIYEYKLRLYMPDYRSNTADYYDFIENVREVLRGALAKFGIYYGMTIGKSRILADSPDGAFAELDLEMLYIEDSRITLYGTELVQSIFSEGIEDATLTGINAGSSVLANLKDRDPATPGFEHTASGYMGVEIDLGSERVCDYLIVGGETFADVTAVAIDYWDGSAWVSLFNDLPATDGSGGIALYSFDAVTAEKFRIRYLTGSSSLLQLGYILLGERYTFPKSYDLKDSSLGVDTANIVLQAGLDDVTGFRNRFQDAGTEKHFWDVSYGLSRNDVDQVVAALMAAQIDQKNFVFSDTYRNDALHLVRLQDENIRANQVFEDYIRIKLQMAEV